MAHRRSHRSHRARRTHRRRGGGYSFGSPYLSPGNLVVQPNRQPGGPDCLAASRPGELSSLPYGGLPGMRGGRYMSSLPASVLDGGRGIIASPPQAVRIPCESTTSTSNPLNLRGGSRMEVGSSASLAAYHAPTAGYGNVSSSSGNVPLMIQVPYAAKSCLSTGGGSRKKRRHRKHKASRRRRQS